MRQKHIIHEYNMRCDNCGKQKKLVTAEVFLWPRIRLEPKEKVDLCPKCWELALKPLTGLRDRLNSSQYGGG